MDGWQRRYRLSNGPGGLGVSCTAEGLALAGVPLLAKGTGGFQARPAVEVETLLRRAYASREPGATAMPGLTKIAEALNQGDLVQAMIRAVHLRLPELDWDAAVRLARANDNLAKYSPDQPRDWHGRWTDGGGGEKEPNVAIAGPTVAEAKPLIRQAQEVQEMGTGTSGGESVPPAGDGEEVQVATASDLAIPLSPQAAPLKIKFADELEQEFGVRWANSFPGGHSLEDGGTLVAAEDGTISMQNIGGVRRESERIDLDINIKNPIDYGLIGIYHTHPYDGTEGNLTDISFSGTDAHTLITKPLVFSIVRSGEGEFLMLKTRLSSTNKTQQQMEDEQRADAERLTQSGISYPAATRLVAEATARRYNLALYQKKNGVFERVVP